MSQYLPEIFIGLPVKIVMSTSIFPFDTFVLYKYFVDIFSSRLSRIYTIKFLFIKEKYHIDLYGIVQTKLNIGYKQLSLKK